MQFPLHLFPPLYGFPQLFCHSLPDLLLPSDFLFGHLNHRIEVDLNALNKIKLLHYIPIQLFNPVPVDPIPGLVLPFGEVSQLTFVVKSHSCELLIQVTHKTVRQLTP